MAVLDKVDLNTFQIVEKNATFPAPGALVGRVNGDVLDDPGAWFTAAGLMPPDGTVGFGWWPRVDLSLPLGLLEGHGSAEPIVDQANRRTTITRPVVKPTVEALAAEYDRLEVVLHQQIEAGALVARVKIYNPDPSKAAIHTRKAEMAADIVAGTTPDPVKHDYIVEEAALRGITPEALAAVVVARVAAVAAAGKPIELAQQAAEIAVTGAKGDRAAMEHAADVDWSKVGGGQ